MSAVSAKEAENSKDVVTDTFSVLNKPVKVLFDTGASHSFISESRCKALGLGNAEKVL